MDWQPIETYKGGKALFFCPPEKTGRMIYDEYYTMSRPVRREVTHWTPLTPPEAKP